MKRFIQRAIGKGRRILAARFQRREVTIATRVPLISFSFDDAPRSAFDVGGKILRENGACATYYMSLGLLKSQTEIGPIAEPEQLVRAVDAGHELGCHTFHHHDAWLTARRAYIASIEENQRALWDLLPGYAFRTFAYPKSGAKLSVKAPLERRFECCRGGGQSINVGTVDLNLLSACFLDRRARVDIEFVRSLIDTTVEARGWLIFAAHDISDDASEFSCPVGFFRSVVRHAVESGAAILPVAAACSRLQSTAGERGATVHATSGGWASLAGRQQAGTSGETGGAQSRPPGARCSHGDARMTAIGGWARGGGLMADRMAVADGLEGGQESGWGRRGPAARVLRDGADDGVGERART